MVCYQYNSRQNVKKDNDHEIFFSSFRICSKPIVPPRSMKSHCIPIKSHCIAMKIDCTPHKREALVKFSGVREKTAFLPHHRRLMNEAIHNNKKMQKNLRFNFFLSFSHFFLSLLSFFLFASQREAKVKAMIQIITNEFVSGSVIF